LPPYTTPPRAQHTVSRKVAVGDLPCHALLFTPGPGRRLHRAPTPWGCTRPPRAARTPRATPWARSAPALPPRPPGAGRGKGGPRPGGAPRPAPRPLPPSKPICTIAQPPLAPRHGTPRQAALAREPAGAPLAHESPCPVCLSTHCHTPPGPARPRPHSIEAAGAACGAPTFKLDQAPARRRPHSVSGPLFGARPRRLCAHTLVRPRRPLALSVNNATLPQSSRLNSPSSWRSTPPNLLPTASCLTCHLARPTPPPARATHVWHKPPQRSRSPNGGPPALPLQEPPSPNGGCQPSPFKSPQAPSPTRAPPHPVRLATPPYALPTCVLPMPARPQSPKRTLAGVSTRVNQPGRCAAPELCLIRRGPQRRRPPDPAPPSCPRKPPAGPPLALRATCP
jgi:hypothetical protein